MARNEAIILPVNCIKTHKTFYARYDYAYDEIWVLSYGLKDLPEDMAKDEGSGVAKMRLGNSRTGPQFKCPYCGNRGFVQCGKCKKLTCYAENGQFTCDHCGYEGTVSGVLESLEGDSKRSQ